MRTSTGIQRIGEGPLDQPKYSWASADHFEPLIRAWLKSLKGSRKKNLIGPSKLSVVMPMNGSKRNTREPMETQLARSFLMRSLNENQRKKIYSVEGSLPLGRYLTGYEICRIAAIASPPHVKDYQQNAMQETWNKFVMKKCNGVLIKTYFPSDIEEFHEWDNYADTHYHEPLPPLDTKERIQTF